MAQGLSASCIAELTFVSRYQNQTILNVFHYLNTGGAIASPNGDAELAALANNVYGKLWDAAAEGWLQFLVEDYLLDYAKVQQIAPARQYYVTVGITAAGTGTNPGVPSDVQITMSAQSDRSGRGRTGNKKVTGGPLAALDGNVWNPTFIAQMDMPAQQMSDIINDSTAAPRWQPILYTPGPSPTISNVIGAYTNLEVRVQPTRRFRHGI